ncbi:hypothetical protein [Microbacterium sp.]|uniref:hypothetical protein n=1 Tax=Microbacterium sp. TaxID=51671 RepID=UPI0034448849
MTYVHTWQGFVYLATVIGWFHAYVILDIFSRYVVGWRVENVEDGRLAADRVEQIVTDTGHRPGWLHADGSAAMRSSRP